MGLFDKILEKLDIKKKEVAKPASTTVGSIPKTTTIAGKTTIPAVIPSTKTIPSINKGVAVPAPVAIPVVDVVEKLEKLAAANPQKLNWKTSIVDLLALLGIDHSLADRKELAKELGCPPEKIGGDYSEMNMWLHKTVLQKIAENGGNIPKNLLD
jgi:hypothetical protein